MKKLILLVSIMLLTTVTVIAQKRLVVPYQGAWNYAITNIEIYPNQCFTTEKIQIHSKIKCLESSNRSGFIRCRIEIRNQKIRNYIEILRDIENILSSMKMLYGYHMLQDLPVIY